MAQFANEAGLLFGTVLIWMNTFLVKRRTIRLTTPDQLLLIIKQKNWKMPKSYLILWWCPLFPICGFRYNSNADPLCSRLPAKSSACLSDGWCCGRFPVFKIQTIFVHQKNEITSHHRLCYEYLKPVASDDDTVHHHTNDYFHSCRTADSVDNDYHCRHCCTDYNSTCAGHDCSWDSEAVVHLVDLNGDSEMALADRRIRSVSGVLLVPRNITTR